MRALLALRKDADPDIPILKEAKAEYAKLSSERVRWSELLEQVLAAARQRA